MDSAPKCCQYCFEELTRRPDERASAFATREYCNKQHAGLHTKGRPKHRQQGILYGKKYDKEMEGLNEALQPR